MSSPGTISVLMSVKNGMPFLPAAIQSLKGQSRPADQIILIDDGSTDGTADYLATLSEPPFQIVTLRENIGLAAALNLGLTQCTGDFVARMDSDDLCLPTRFEKQAHLLDENARLSVINTFIRPMTAEGRPLEQVTEAPLTTAEMLMQGIFSVPIFHPACMIRRKALDSLSPVYDPAFTAGQDFDLWSRLLPHTEAAAVAEPLLLYRKHDAAVSAQKQSQQLDARRLAGGRFIGHLLERTRLASWKSDADTLMRSSLGLELDDESHRGKSLTRLWTLLARWKKANPVAVRPQTVSKLAGRIIRANESQGHRVRFSLQLARIAPRDALHRLRPPKQPSRSPESPPKHLAPLSDELTHLLARARSAMQEFSPDSLTS